MKSYWFIIEILFIIMCVNSMRLDEESARTFLNDYDSAMSNHCYQSKMAKWVYNTNITEEAKNIMIETDLQAAKFIKEAWENFTRFDWRNFKDESIKRQFRLGSVLGTAALPDNEYAQLKTSISEMESIYSTTEICQFDHPSECHLKLEPDITQLMMDSRNHDELLDAWTQWHNKVGRAVKKYYGPYVQLSNEAARLNGMNDLGEIWRYPYDDINYEENLAKLWSQLKPFYLQLHAYIRRKLADFYGEGYVSRAGPIPAHLLGDMWAQDWSSLYNWTKPFDSIDELDVTSEMKAQNYTVDRMFRMAEEFFTSLGMEPMTEEFWNNSMFERPNDGREVVCHASAWDFCNGRDFRIKMCTEIRLLDLIIIHHEMGHVQYRQQYKDLPYLFREGANPGFHEAIGDVIALSVSTTKHMAKFNLTDYLNQTTEADINFLYHMALQKLAFLPFGYVVDYWRWNVFRQTIPESKWNEEWWRMRRDYQGIAPSVPRYNIDFDPGAKFHVPADVPYDRYFVATIIQFQFHKALCEIADEYNSTDPSKPLHQCDIFNNQDAGQRFSDIMKLGSSKPWPQIMKLLVGKEEMDASPFIEYFQPLIDFLVNDNNKNGAKIGWE